MHRGFYAVKRPCSRDIEQKQNSDFNQGLMVQITYRNRELTSYPKINHIFVSSKTVFTTGTLSSQYHAAITLCKQSYFDTENTIKIHNIEINPLAINLDVSRCSGANKLAQIRVKTHRSPCRFSLLSIQWYAISGFDDRRCSTEYRISIAHKC